MGNLILHMAQPEFKRKEHKNKEHVEGVSRENVLDKILAFSKDLIFIFDKNRRFSYISTTAAKAFGYKTEELIGKKWTDLKLPFEVTSPFYIKLNAVFVAGKPLTGETIFIFGKELKVYEYTLSPIKDKKGEIESVVAISREITERKKLEGALRESEEKFRTVFEKGPLGIILLGKGNRFLNVNDMFCRMVGYSREELEKMTFEDITLPEDIQLSKKSAKAVFSGKISLVKVEKRYVRKNGEIIWVALTATAIRDERGDVKYLLSIFDDITERKKAEAALHKSESGLKEAQRLAHIGSWEWDRVNNTTLWSEEYFRIHSLDPSKPAPGLKEHLKLHSGESAKRLNTAVKRLMKTGEPYEIDVELANPTDSTRWLIARGEAMYDTKGKIIGLRGTSQNITERKEVEEKLHATALYTRSLIETSLDPFVTIGKEGKITDVNKATEEVTGVSREKLIGSDFSDYFTEPEKAKEGYRQVFKKGFVRDYPLAIRHTSGKVIDVLYNASIFKNEQGEVQGVFAAARDITKRKKVEEALIASQNRLKAISQIALKVSSTMNIDERLKHILEGTLEATGATVGMIFLKDRETGLFKLGASIGLSEAFVELYRKQFIKPGEGLTGRIAQTGEIVYIAEDSSHDPRIARPVIEAEGLNSFIGVPLRAGTEIVGVMNILTRPPDVLSEQETVLINAIGANIGFTLRNALLFAERQKLEEALRESEEKFRTVFEKGPLGVVIRGKGNRFLNVNDVFCQMLGYSREELEKMSFKDITLPEDIEMHKKSAEALFSGKVPSINIENRYVRKNGEIIWVALTSTAIRDETGKVKYLITILEDITERKKAEEEIKRRKETAIALINASIHPSLLVGKGGLVYEINDAALKYVNKTRDEVLGLKNTDLFPPETAKKRNKQIEKVFKSRKPTRFIDEVEGVIFDNSMYPVLDSHGDVDKVAVFAEDITERQKAEKALRKSESGLKETQRLAHIGSWDWDAVNDTMWWSEEFYILHGLDPKETAPNYKEHLKLHTLESAKKFDDSIKQTMKTGVPFEIDLELAEQTLSRQWIVARGEAKRDVNGKIKGVRGTAQDITERKKTEEKLHNTALYTRSLIETSLDPFVTIGKEGKITDVNKATEEVTGVSREKLIGSDFSDYFTEPEKAKEGYRQVFKKGFVRDYPLAIRHTSGKVIDVLYNASIFKNEQGEVQGVFAAARDVTERKKAEAQLKKYLFKRRKIS